MIRFPRMHIATSVVNRILNAADDLRPAIPQAYMAPSVPDPEPAGAAIDQALQQPVGEVAPVSDETLAALEPGIIEGMITG